MLRLGLCFMGRGCLAHCSLQVTMDIGVTRATNQPQCWHDCCVRTPRPFLSQRRRPCCELMDEYDEVEDEVPTVLLKDSPFRPAKGRTVRPAPSAVRRNLFSAQADDPEIVEEVEEEACVRARHLVAHESAAAARALAAAASARADDADEVPEELTSTAIGLTSPCKVPGGAAQAIEEEVAEEDSCKGSRLRALKPHVSFGGFLQHDDGVGYGMPSMQHDGPGPSRHLRRIMSRDTQISEVTEEERRAEYSANQILKQILSFSSTATTARLKRCSESGLSARPSRTAINLPSSHSSGNVHTARLQMRNS